MRFRELPQTSDWHVAVTLVQCNIRYSISRILDASGRKSFGENEAIEGLGGRALTYPVVFPFDTPGTDLELARLTKKQHLLRFTACGN